MADRVEIPTIALSQVCCCSREGVGGLPVRERTQLATLRPYPPSQRRVMAAAAQPWSQRVW
jgi:hypothetical protein